MDAADPMDDVPLPGRVIVTAVTLAIGVPCLVWELGREVVGGVRDAVVWKWRRMRAGIAGVPR